MSKLKYPTEEAWEHISRLFRGPGTLNRIAGRPDPRLKDLEALDRFKEPGLIPYLVPILLDPYAKVAERAGQMIKRRLEGISDEMLRELDPAMRRYPAFLQAGGPWPDVKDLKKLKRFEDPAPFLGLFSFVSNGYVREKATRRLCQNSSGVEIPYLLLRLNDWVPHVRIVAKTGIISRIKPENIAGFVDHFYLIERIYSWGREDHSDVLTKFERALAHPASRDQLMRGLKHPDFRARRRSVGIAARYKVIASVDLYRIITRDPDPIVRLRFAANVHGLGRSQLLSLTEILTSDGYMKVRREALELSIKNDLENREKLLMAALRDPHISIRSLARWHLKKQGLDKEFFRNFYLEAIKGSNPEIGSLLGIGETGEKDDALLLLPWLDHERVKIRRAAFRAAGWLDPQVLKDRAFENLQKESPSMVKESGSFISSHFSMYDPWQLWSVFQNTKEKLVKICVLSIIEHFPKWQKLIWLLEAGEERSQHIRSNVENRLAVWMSSFNQSFMKPNDEELSRIRDLISKSALNPCLLRDIEGFIRYF